MRPRAKFLSMMVLFFSLILSGLLILGGLVVTASAQQVTLRFVAHADPPGPEMLEKLCEEFSKEHPNINVKFEHIPYGQIMAKLTTQIIGGEPPDVADLLDRWAKHFAGMDALIPINEYIPEGFENIFLPEHWKYMESEGKQIGVPYCVGIQALLYNKDIFSEVGIPVPEKFEDAWSWHQLLKIAKEVKEKANLRYGFVHWPFSTPSRISQYLVAEGGSVLSEDLTKPAIDSPIAIRFLTEVQETFTTGLVPPENWLAGQTWPDPMLKLFTLGRVALRCGSGGHEIRGLIEITDFEWGFTPMPTTLAVPGSLVMFKGGRHPHPKEAFEFISYLIRPDILLKTAVPLFSIPARTDIPLAKLVAAYPAGHGKDIGFLIKEQMKGFSPQIANEMGHVAWSEIDMMLRGKLEELSLQLKSPEVMAKEAAAEISKILKKYEK